MAEGSTIGDLLKKAGGVVSSAAESYENPPPWLKLLIGAGLGAATSYGPPGLAARSGENYAAARGHARARQQLIDFAKSIGVEHPEMLPETTTPGDILPRYTPLKTGQVLVEPFGKPPHAMTPEGLTLPQPKPLKVGTAEERSVAASLVQKELGRPPQTEDEITQRLDAAREIIDKRKLGEVQQRTNITQGAITGRQREREGQQKENAIRTELRAIALNPDKFAQPEVLASQVAKIEGMIRDLPPKRRTRFMGPLRKLQKGLAAASAPAPAPKQKGWFDWLPSLGTGTTAPAATEAPQPPLNAAQKSRVDAAEEGTLFTLGGRRYKKQGGKLVAVQ